MVESSLLRVERDLIESAIRGVPDNVISPRSRKMLKHSVANLKKDLASAPIAFLKNEPW